MTKLTKRQYQELVTIRGNIKRAYDYMQRPDVVGIAHAVKDGLENGGDYTIRNENVINTCPPGMAKHIRPLNKDIGSDIAGLQIALSEINVFLEKNAI